jgi:hypothetical protein
LSKNYLPWPTLKLITFQDFSAPLGGFFAPIQVLLGFWTLLWFFKPKLLKESFGRLASNEFP